MDTTQPSGKCPKAGTTLKFRICSSVSDVRTQNLFYNQNSASTQTSPSAFHLFSSFLFSVQGNMKF